MIKEVSESAVICGEDGCPGQLYFDSNYENNILICIKCGHNHRAEEKGVKRVEAI